MKTIKSIEEKIEKLNVLNQEMTEKMSKYCGNIDNKKSIPFDVSFFLLLPVAIVFVLLSFTVLSDMLIYTLITIFLVSILAPLVFKLINAINSESDYDIYLKNEKIESAVQGLIFNKEEIQNYYEFLNSVYGSELDFILKSEMKENEETGSYHLLKRLFEKALIRLNEEKISLN